MQDGTKPSASGACHDLNVDLPYIDAHCHVFSASYIKPPTGAVKNTPTRRPGQPVQNGIVFVKKSTWKSSAPEEWILTGRNHLVIWTESRMNRDVPHDVCRSVYVEGVVVTDDEYWQDGKPQLQASGKYGKFVEPRYQGRIEKTGLDEVRDGSLVQILNLRIFGHGDPVATEERKTNTVLSAIPNYNGARAIIPLILDLSYHPLPGGVDWADIAIRGDAFLEEESPYYANDDDHVFLRRDNLQRVIEASSRVAAAHPGEVFPFVPFDPRRPDGLDHVKDAIKSKGFAGVKLYSRTGWMPLRNQTIYPGQLGAELDGRLRKLYQWCQQEDVPLLNHTSPGGFPPEGVLVLPRIYTDDDYAAAHPLGIPQRPNRAELWADTAASVLRRHCIDMVWEAVREVASLSHYVQHTVSPHMWEPVLSEFPKLRLSFGHCGGGVSMAYQFDGLLDELRAGATKNESNAATLREAEMFGIVGPPDRFAAAFKQQVLTVARIVLKQKFSDHARTGPYSPRLDVVPEYYYRTRAACSRFAIFEYCADVEDHTLDEVDAQLEIEWAEICRGHVINNWLDEWRQQFPVGWTEKIGELLGKDNVYADISYLAGADPAFFRKVMRSFLKYVGYGTADEKSAWVQKIQIGTDWFMTEMMDQMHAGEMWRRYETGMYRDGTRTSAEFALFQKWAVENPMAYLNLGKRLPDLKSFYENSNPGACLPPWMTLMDSEPA